MVVPHLSGFRVEKYGNMIGDRSPLVKFLCQTTWKNSKTRRIIDGFPIYQASMAENISQAIINATFMMAIVGKEGKKERYREQIWKKYAHADGAGKRG